MNTGEANSLARLLITLGAYEIELAAHPTDPERVRHRPALLPVGVAALLPPHKPAVCRLMREGFTPPDVGDAPRLLAERLAMAEAMGFPNHRGSPAWLVAVGEIVGYSYGTGSNETG